jgi:FtsP/CotA-like multicopper oxidase with cupredoxin domain
VVVVAACSPDALVPFTQPTVPGKFVYHCHILGHEDNGMMANIVVAR